MALDEVGELHYTPFPHFPDWVRVGSEGAWVGGQRVYYVYLCRSCDASKPLTGVVEK